MERWRRAAKGEWRCSQRGKWQHHASCTEAGTPWRMPDGQASPTWSDPFMVVPVPEMHGLWVGTARHARTIVLCWPDV